MEFKEIDEEYLKRMVQFEVDCGEGEGNSMACHQLGEFYSVVKDDHKKAAAVYEKNCATKDYAPSCFNLARILIAGKDCDLDDEKAKSLFAKSCRLGHLQGCHHHALMMFYGWGGNSRQVDEAVNLFESNCASGDRESCYMAGAFFLNKSNTKRDPSRAVALLDAACQRAHGPSCFNLAVLFKTGDTSIQPDEAKHNHYKSITEELVATGGALRGKRVG